MPSSHNRIPKAATCEEVDETTQTIKPDSQTSANVSKKRSQSSDLNEKSTADKQSQHGSDSGYSSKAGTNESMASSYKRPNPLTVNTNVVDRASRPYSLTPAKSEPAARPINAEATKQKGSKKDQKVRHAQGTCRSCDLVGFHCELSEIAPNVAAAKAKAKANKDINSAVDKKKARRTSSHTGERPNPFNVLLPPQQPVPVIYTPTTTYPPPYPPLTPLTPSPYHLPQYYTPVSAPCHECLAIADGSHSHQHPMTPQYLEFPTTSYPLYHEQPLLHANYHQPSNELERTIAYAPRARSATSRPSKTQADKLAMPPPPKPVLRRLSTENNHAVARRASVHYEDDERPIVASKRTSRDLSSLPPSAWKGSGFAEVAERPQSKKAASYSDASTDHSATHQREPLSRRVTDPVDERSAQAEAYQAKISRGGSGTLTTEALKKLEKQRSLGSEAGTAQSKDSARGKRSGTVVSNSGRTNIIVDGGINISFPEDMSDQDLHLQIGKLTISTNNQKETKRIERASSNASRGSRRTPSGASAAGDPESSQPATRRSTHAEKPRNSPPSSKRSSRAPSMARSGS